MAAGGATGDFEARLAALRARFQASLGAQIEALASALTAAADAPPVDAHRIAHKLAGTAPSLGFAEIGAVARELEAALDPAVAEARGARAAELGLARARLEALAAAARHG
jgi:HPt (histidine-containing phosphotransfer) domain-containing protein